MKKTLLMVFLGVVYLETSAISISFSTTNAACGFNSGSIVAYVSGGSSPYAYLWNTSATTPDIFNLVPGVYTLLVTDSNGDTTSASTTVSSTSGITGGSVQFISGPFVNPVIYSYPCQGQCNGNAFLRVDLLNGVPPYALSTNPLLNIGVTASNVPNAPDIPTIYGLCSEDVYTAMVTDANGCTGTVFVEPPYAPNNYSVIQTVLPACNGTNSGQILLEFPNLNGSYYGFTCTGPSSLSGNLILGTALFDSLLPGVYDFTVWDEYAVAPCPDTTFSITVPDLGSNCGTVSGNVFLDSTTNCMHDVGEPLLPSRMIRITPGPYYSTTDNAGNFSQIVPFGTYDLETIDNYYFNSSCFVSGITLNGGTPTVSGIALGDSTGSDLDLSVTLSAGQAQPGFPYTLYVQLSNYSYLSVTAPQVIVDFDAVLSFNTSNYPFNLTGPTQVTLDFPTMSGFQSLTAIIGFTVPPQPSLIGQLLINNATLIANQPEVNTQNNQFTLQQIIVGSFDPNDKAVWPASDPLNIFLVDVDSVFQYTIRFQNTGTAAATTVKLIDTLNTYLDVETFEVLGSSHPYTWQINQQNILEVTYDNIMLPDSNTNEPGSHGLFSFAISPTPALSNAIMPYILENTAVIYFDFNPPVITNTVFNTIDWSVGLQENISDVISVHPNPATDQLFIRAATKQPVDAITILDVSGRVVWEQKGNWSQLVVPTGKLQDGLYLIRIDAGKDVYQKRFVKM